MSSDATDNTMRAEFEGWAFRLGFMVKRAGGDGYKSQEVTNLWWAWQAARAGTARKAANFDWINKNLHGMVSLSFDSPIDDDVGFVASDGTWVPVNSLSIGELGLAVDAIRARSTTLDAGEKPARRDLDEQISAAQAEKASWTPERRAQMRLQGGTNG